MRGKTEQLVSILLALVLISCNKEVRENEVRETKFYASFNKNFNTKGESLFPSGNRALIFCYSGGSTLIVSEPLASTPKSATADISGALNTAVPIILPKGLYDFYSISENNQAVPSMIFTSGTSEILENGKDYLWAKQTSVSQGGSVNFMYNHIATGVEVIVNPGDGVENLDILSVKITPSQPGSQSRLNLENGVIGVSNAKGELTLMNETEGKWNYIMLPSETLGIEIEVTVNVDIGGERSYNKVYRATIPEQSYTGGTLYSIGLILKADSVIFSGSVIRDWNTQIITGIILSES